VSDKHPVALETQHKGTKTKAKRKADQEGDANYDLAYESVDLDEGEDKEPASPDEASMAMKQADFLAYVGREMKDHLKAGKEFPEWMQNKLSKLNQAAQDLHSNFGAHGEDDMDEALSPKQKKIDHNKNGKIDGQDLAMIRAKKNEGFASDAQRKAIWASKNEKGVKEELKGDQHKIDKNKNGKIDAHDFKLLKKESLDELQSWVEKKFSSVVNKQLPKVHIPAEVYKADSLATILEIVPIRDVKKIDVYFPCPPVEHLYISKPSRYVIMCL
jgi:hypothetical protein